MRLLIKWLVLTVLVMVLAMVIPGIEIRSYYSAAILVLVLGLLNSLVKPVLVVLTIPVTIVTFGLFLLVINALIVLLAASISPGFEVAGFFPALLFALGNSVFTYLLSLSDRGRDNK